MSHPTMAEVSPEARVCVQTLQTACVFLFTRVWILFYRMRSFKTLVKVSVFSVAANEPKWADTETETSLPSSLVELPVKEPDNRLTVTKYQSRTNKKTIFLPVLVKHTVSAVTAALLWPQPGSAASSAAIAL